MAAGELAVVLPLLMLITLGCVDFGRFAYTYISVTNAARAGAAYAMMNNFATSTTATWNANVAAAAQAESNLAGVTVPAPTTSTDATGLKRASVTVTYQFHTIITWPGVPSSVAVGRTVSVRVIR